MLLVVFFTLIQLMDLYGEIRDDIVVTVRRSSVGD